MSVFNYEWAYNYFNVPLKDTYQRNRKFAKQLIFAIVLGSNIHGIIYPLVGYSYEHDGVTRCQCYQTFFSFNLRIFVMSYYLSLVIFTSQV